MSELPRAHESAVTKERPKFIQAVKRVLGFIWSNWLVLGFGLACILGYFFPRMLAETWIS